MKEDGKHHISREYIDKLFIFSIKLGSLSKDESIEFFSKISKEDIMPESDTHIEVDDSTHEAIPNNTSKEAHQKSLQIPSNTETTTQQQVTINKPTKKQNDIFKSNLQHITNSTPRKNQNLILQIFILQKLGNT